MNGEGFTRRRGGAEGERDEVGFGVEDFQPRMGTNGEGMGAKKYLSISSFETIPRPEKGSRKGRKGRKG